MNREQHIAAPRLVSVVVPTRNSSRTLRSCLQSVRSQSYPRIELIVVDNQSTDATPSIARDVADIVVDRGPERSAQRNHGWRISHGDYVAFVDSDMVLDPGVVAAAVAAFDADPLCGAVVVPELAFGVGFLATCRVLEKQLYLGDPAAEAARVFRRVALARCAGFDESLTGPEDWDLHDRVAESWRVGRIAPVVWHDEGRISLRQQFLKKRYYGRDMLKYWRRRSHRGRPVVRRVARRELLQSPVRAAGLLFLKMVESAGVIVGMAESRPAR